MQWKQILSYRVDLFSERGWCAVKRIGSNKGVSLGQNDEHSNNGIQSSWIQVYCGPNGHMTFIQCRLNVDAASWRCIDVEATLYTHHVSAGVYVDSENSGQLAQSNQVFAFFFVLWSRQGSLDISCEVANIENW